MIVEFPGGSHENDTVRVRFNIKDDLKSKEPPESFDIFLADSSASYIKLGPLNVTNVIIRDNDGVFLCVRGAVLQ